MACQFPISYRGKEKAFLLRMNMAIQKCEGYENGMSVNGDASGYWLEINGVEVNKLEHKGLLSQAAKRVKAAE
jgi:hypothetical protein